MQLLLDRMLRAARLDAQLYEEVEADEGAMRQAMLVVVLSSLAAGIGSLSSAGGIGLVAGAIGALIGWYIWAALTYFIGTRWLPGQRTEATIGQLLRTTGFSSAPGLLRIIGVIAPLAALVNIVAGIWQLLAMIIAVRQALDYESTGRAVAVCIIGFVVQVALLAVIFLLIGPPELHP
jgi:hypothetical protein